MLPSTSVVSRIARGVLRRVPFFEGRGRLKPPPPRPDVWSIGLLTGDDPLALNPLQSGANPILRPEDVRDRRCHLVADPFLFRRNGTWHLFFEAESTRGEIGHATSRDGRKWRYRGIVLAEPFHLSYPCVFEWEGSIYMVPESHQAGAVRLYRAERFPSDWRWVTNLLEGSPFSDPTLFRHGGRWWMLVEITDFRFDTLHLFSAPSLTGPWVEHPRSPVVEGDPQRARPAGRVLQLDGKLIRFAQDCVPSYGRRVRAMEITRLEAHAYEERELGQSPVLAGTTVGWNAAGMHHLDAHRLGDGQWFAAVDGWFEQAVEGDS